MRSDELREKYLSFFESQGCVRRPSDVLVPHGDKSVLFTPAGMNQFKNQFLGIGPLEFTKATTCQKCIRTGDIDNVGVTAYHHTFFEMLGNFSFGDYFKKEAIHWAWEFLTSKKWLGLDGERMRVTVYLDDDEAYNIWHNEIKLPANRISRENEHENFWPAAAPSQGPDGVCGPCSEIYFHPEGSKKDVEIWNLVFTQFNRVGAPPDNLRPLPKKNIDTGMGLERTASTLQKVESNFEIDILKPLVLSAAEAVGVKYDFHAAQGRPIRRIADHIRACTFCLHEGVQPSAERQGYIVRLLLRRAFLEGYLLGQREPFLHQLVPSVVECMRAAYPDIASTVQTVMSAVKGEEEQFLSTIDRGIKRFDQLVEQSRQRGESLINGKDAADLHTTYGFLLELTQTLAAQHNLQVDKPGYEEAMGTHRDRSGRGAFAAEVMAAGPLAALHKTAGGTEFLGYETLQADTELVGIIAEGQLVEKLEEVGHESPVGLVLNRTPFYGEAGGQVGDVGELTAAGIKFEVTDTQRDGNLLIHIGHLRQGKLQLGQKLTAQVATGRRAGIRRAHSATHLLHHALHEVLGSSALQRGSKVDEDVLRFDFAQTKPITQDELSRIEEILNHHVSLAAPVRADLMDLEAAKKTGAMALFGEKYPDRVRVVSMGDFSRELCGGTHLSNTGEVGFCKVLYEESVSKGVRRITAFTGPKAVEHVRQQEALLRELAGQLKASRVEDLPQRIAALQEELKQAKRELNKQSAQSASSALDTMLAQAEKIGDVTLVTHLVENADADALRALIDQVRRKASPAAVLLGSVSDGKPVLIAAFSPELVQKGHHAGEWVKAAAKLVGGGGGGRPDLAQAGGKDPSKMSEAIAAGLNYLKGKLGV